MIITVCAPCFRVHSSRSWRKSAASRAPARATTNVDVDGDSEADDGSDDLEAECSELGLLADATSEDWVDWDVDDDVDGPGTSPRPRAGTSSPSSPTTSSSPLSARSGARTERSSSPLQSSSPEPAPRSNPTGAPGLVIEVKNNSNCHIDMSQSTFTFNNERLGGGSALTVERPHSSTQTLKFKAGAVPGVEVLPGYRDDIMTVKRSPADLWTHEAREQRKRGEKKANALSFMMGHRTALSSLSCPSAFCCKHCPRTFAGKQGCSNHQRSCPLRHAKAPKGSSRVRPVESTAAEDDDGLAALGSDAAAASDTSIATNATTAGPTSSPTKEKKGGRRGAPVRRSHSWSFKSRVLKQYDWYKLAAGNDKAGASTFGRQLGSTSSMTPALMTAMQFCINDSLVCVPPSLCNGALMVMNV